MALRIDGTGTASVLEGSTEVTLVDNGTGDYTLTFDTAFKRVPIVVGMAVGASAAIVTASSVSASAVTIKTYDAAGNAVDADFHLQIIGFDDASYV
jgi:hypothetical protein